MLTATTLKSYTAKDLAQMARNRGISGWHAMKKEQLVKAIVRVASKSNGTASGKSAGTKGGAAKSTPAKTVGLKGNTVAKSGVVAARSVAEPAQRSKSREAGNGANNRLPSKPAANGANRLTSGEKLAVSSAAKKETDKKVVASKSESPNKGATGRANGTKSAATLGNRAANTKHENVFSTSPGFRPAPAPPVANGTTKRVGVSSSADLAPAKPKSKGVIRKIQAVHQAREAKMDLATVSIKNGEPSAVPTEDRIVLLVRDPYWLQAHWELTARCVERAQAALKERWHSARPVLRLLSITNSNVSNNPECVIRVIDIHGAVHNWFIDVVDPPSSYRVEIGYLAADDHFYSLARSNPVTTPRPGSADMLESNWVDLIDNPEKIFALSGGYDENGASGELQSLFEDRLRRPMGVPMMARFGNGAEAALNRDREMQFTIDAEMVVYGVTNPHAYVTMSGEPVKLREDGTFVARVSLPDRRQVIPIVASSGDGVEERTIVLAIEKNTKVMEPKMREPGE